MTDLPLIKRVALTKKPMIISTGLSSLKEIEETFKFAKRYGAKDITLLYCVSNYPAKNIDFNLNNKEVIYFFFFNSGCKMGFPIIKNLVTFPFSSSMLDSSISKL